MIDKVIIVFIHSWLVSMVTGLQLCTYFIRILVLAKKNNFLMFLLDNCLAISA